MFSHEITHRLKEASSADYLAFAQLAEEQLRRTGEYDSLASRIRDAYGELSPDALADEMVAHYAQNLVTSIDEFERLAGINRNLAQKLLDWLEMCIRDRHMQERGITASFALGGMTASIVEMFQKKLVRVLECSQSFDSVAARAMAGNPNIVEIDNAVYSNAFTKGALLDLSLIHI